MAHVSLVALPIGPQRLRGRASEQPASPTPVSPIAISVPPTPLSRLAHEPMAASRAQRPIDREGPVTAFSAQGHIEATTAAGGQACRLDAFAHACPGVHKFSERKIEIG